MSAIDASVALANRDGEFVKTDGGEIQYQAKPATENFAITMFSRKGIFPEADFYHPIPYEPLGICNADAIEGLIAKCNPEETLKAVFVDNYATVPHDSIRRMLALHASGKLAVIKLA